MFNDKNVLKAAEKGALEGGEILKKYWGKIEKVEQKSSTWDLVTEADRESEETIIRILQKATPDYAILSEEAGLYKDDPNQPMWVIDPLDGTTNYTHQYPFVAVNIALLVEKKPVVAITYNPILDEYFRAVQGGGATFNNKPIHVSKVTELNQSLLVTGFPYDRDNNRDNNYREFFRLTQLSQGVRRAGSAAIDLAYVAAGRLDGYWEHGLKPWDIAAGVLLVQEAGGKVSSYDLSAIDIHSGRILASNGLIHEKFSKEILLARNSTNP